MSAPPVTDAETGTDPLVDYRAGDALFASPRGTLLARVPPGGTGRLSAVPDLLATARDFGLAAASVVGAVPFDPDRPGRLALAETLRRAPAARRSSGPAAAGDWRLRPAPSRQHYRQAVARAVRLVAERRLDKVVLARTLRCTAGGPVDPAAVLTALAARNPHGYTFAVPAGEGRTLLGASPELLVSRTGRQVRSHPLAGSAARSTDPVEDRRRAEALRRSAKDLREHALVVDAVVRALRPYCATLHVPDGPRLTRTGDMWHLGTPITGTVADPDVSCATLAAALHPTPAVCGVPTAAARRAIDELEGFDRDLYSGTVGWCDADGDGEWAVTLRCAMVDRAELVLYAGAGIVPGSEPDAELAETDAKLRTMLAALDIPGGDR